MNRGEQRDAFERMLREKCLGHDNYGCEKIKCKVEGPDTREAHTGLVTVELETPGTFSTPIYAKLDCDAMKVVEVYALW